MTKIRVGCAHCQKDGLEPGFIWTDNNRSIGACPICNTGYVIDKVEQERLIDAARQRAHKLIKEASAEIWKCDVCGTEFRHGQIEIDRNGVARCPECKTIGSLHLVLKQSN